MSEEMRAPSEQPEPELDRLRRALAQVTRDRDLLFSSMPLSEAKAVLSGRDRPDRMPDDAPETAKVIVVTEAGGRERRYDADSWAPFGEHGLDVARNSRPGDSIVGRYAAGAWLSVREEGALVNDGPADKRKLGIALAALEAIASSDGTAGKHARTALADIADVDL